MLAKRNAGLPPVPHEFVSEKPTNRLLSSVLRTQVLVWECWLPSARLQPRLPGEGAPERGAKFLFY